MVTANIGFKRAIFIFTLVALFLFYEMGLQVYPTIITDDLMSSLNLSAVQLGMMSGFYYYIYAACQIPAGLTFDRYKVRSALLVPIFICAIGAFIFSHATSMFGGSVARMLMGAGSAFSFTAVLVVAADLFEAKYFALLAGITQLFAGLGAMGGEALLSPLMNYMDWRIALQMFAVIGGVLLVFIWFFADYPCHSQSKNKTEQKNVWQSFLKITKNSQSWFAALYACLSFAPVLTFSGLWGVAYLTRSNPDMSPHTAALITSLMWLGFALGSPFFGWWSDRIGQRRLPLILSALLGLLMFVCALFLPLYLSLPGYLLGIFIFLSGIATAGHAVSFALVKENNCVDTQGVALGFNNMGVVVSGAIFQPIVGFIMQSHAMKNSTGGLVSVAESTAADYRFGLGVLPLCYLGAALLAMFAIKETHCLPIEKRNA